MERRSSGELRLRSTEEKTATGSGAHSTSRGGEMSLAGPGSADQQ